MKTWEKGALAATAGVIGAYLGGHVVHHFDKLNTINRMLADLPEGSSVLNVGCKNWSLFKSKLNHFRVTNIDVTPRDVPNFVLADVRDLSMFDDNSFDGILCSHVLEHIPRENVNIAFSEMNRICKDQTKVYIVLPRWWIPTTWLDLEHKWVPVGRRIVEAPIAHISDMFISASGERKNR